jgi:hypothetical protein
VLTLNVGTGHAKDFSLSVSGVVQLLGLADEQYFLARIGTLIPFITESIYLSFGGHPKLMQLRGKYRHLTFPDMGEMPNALDERIAHSYAWRQRPLIGNMPVILVKWIMAFRGSGAPRWRWWC